MLHPLPRCSRWAYLSLKNRPAVSAFPDSTFGSACTLTFSRIARRLLTLRPAHSRGHQFRDRYPGASDISSPSCLPRLLPAGAVAGRGLHPLDKRRLVTAHAECDHFSGHGSQRAWVDGVREQVLESKCVSSSVTSESVPHRGHMSAKELSGLALRRRR